MQSDEITIMVILALSMVESDLVLRLLMQVDLLVFYLRISYFYLYFYHIALGIIVPFTQFIWQ